MARIIITVVGMRPILFCKSHALPEIINRNYISNTLSDTGGQESLNPTYIQHTYASCNECWILDNEGKGKAKVVAFNISLCGGGATDIPLATYPWVLRVNLFYRHF